MIIFFLLVFIVESQEQDLTHNIGKALKLSETVRPDVKVDDAIVPLDREREEESYRIRKYIRTHHQPIAVHCWT